MDVVNVKTRSMAIAFNSNLALSDTDNLAHVSPNQADWITSHADATGLAVVEIERLWNRFKQLTGSSDQTSLNPQTSALPNELSNDVFVRNLLKHFPRSKTNVNEIPFGYFILVIQWFESAKVEDKLRAIYVYLNNGEELESGMLFKLLKHLYPDAKEEEVRVSTNQLMKDLGSTENGRINQQQFITAVQRLIPAQQLEEILGFSIIPAQILEEANMIPSLETSTMNIRDNNPFSTVNLISDEQLRQIAVQSSSRSWHVLILNLGFLEYDIEAYLIQSNRDPIAAVFTMLQSWREREGAAATKDKLKSVLRTSGFADLTPLLDR